MILFDFHIVIVFLFFIYFPTSSINAYIILNTVNAISTVPGKIKYFVIDSITKGEARGLRFEMSKIGMHYINNNDVKISVGNLCFANEEITCSILQCLNVIFTLFIYDHRLISIFMRTTIGTSFKFTTGTWKFKLILKTLIEKLSNT